MKKMEKNEVDINKYKTLIKLYDQADVINDIV
jgi:ATP-dependent DNA helicase RecG